MTHYASARTGLHISANVTGTDTDAPHVSLSRPPSLVHWLQTSYKQRPSQREAPPHPGNDSAETRTAFEARAAAFCSSSRRAALYGSGQGHGSLLGGQFFAAGSLSQRGFRKLPSSDQGRSGKSTTSLNSGEQCCQVDQHVQRAELAQGVENDIRSLALPSGKFLRYWQYPKV